MEQFGGPGNWKMLWQDPSIFAAWHALTLLGLVWWLPGQAVAQNRGAPAITRVQGRVVGPDGKPVAGATVLNLTHVDSLSAPAETKADARGRFSLEVKDAAAIEIRARKGDLATRQGTPVTDRIPLTLRLEKNVLASISGRVIDAADRPLRGIKVVLLQSWAGRGSVIDRVTTDGAGRYTFSGLWPQVSYSVFANHQAFSGEATPEYGQKNSRTFELAAGAVAQEELVLKTVAGVIAGRVVDEGGIPVAGEAVVLSGRETPQRQVTTDEGGRFRFEQVADEASLKVLIRSTEDPDLWVPRKVKVGELDVVLVRKQPQGPLSKVRAADLVGRAAPQWESASWLNSAPLTVPSVRGKVVLLDFWGVNCGPCVGSLPQLEQLWVQFRSRGALVIGVHDQSANREQLSAFLRERRVTYPVALDTPEEGTPFGKTFARYGVLGEPIYGVLDQEGKLVYLDHDLAGAVAAVGKLLK